MKLRVKGSEAQVDFGDDTWLRFNRGEGYDLLLRIERLLSGEKEEFILPLAPSIKPRVRRSLGIR